MRSVVEANRLHEAHYRVIFGSQLRALRQLNFLGRAPASQFEPFFQEIRDDPDTAPIYEGYTFEQWWQFLLNAGYVRSVGDTDPA